MTRLVGTNFKTKGSFVMGLFAQSCSIHWSLVKSAGKLVLCFHEDAPVVNIRLDSRAGV